MKTYLRLCNDLIGKTGIGGGPLVSMDNQAEESRRVASWINEAYQTIQNLRPNWLWMYADFSFPTAAGKSSYTPSEAGITNFASWDARSFRITRTVDGYGGEQWLDCIDYPSFRDWYQFNGTRSQTGKPHVCAIGPDKSLLLGIAPDAQGYTITGKYFKTPVDLVLATDVPLMPARFHDLIVYEAMQSTGLYEAASEVMAESSRQYRRLKKQLENDQLPALEVGIFE